MTVAANKPFIVALAKTLLLAGPLVVAFMFGIDWLFAWLREVHGVYVPNVLVSLATLAGVFLIPAWIIGPDLRELGRQHEQEKERKRRDRPSL